MIGKVFYVQQQNKNDACGALEQIDITSQKDSFVTPILLVDRGGCTFSQKVRHAQDVGAKAAIIMDNRDEDITQIIMGDDGSAGNIYIPSFLIRQSDGQLIKNYMINNPNEEVSLELTFEMAQQGNKVDYQIYISNANPLIREFLYNFTDLATKFDDSEMHFTPHYVFWYCIQCKEQGYNKEEKDCYSGGRYCAPDPDDDGPRNGRDIVMEDLRQICVFKQSQEKKNPKIW